MEREEEKKLQEWMEEDYNRSLGRINEEGKEKVEPEVREDTLSVPFHKTFQPGS